MIEIKFRVRNSETKKIMGYEFIRDKEWFCIVGGEEFDGIYSLGSECLREQYTELKDKRGAEIYEGDKLSPGAIRKYEFVVFYTDGMFGYKGFDDLFVPLKNHIKHLEVIGDIYENNI